MAKSQNIEGIALKHPQGYGQHFALQSCSSNTWHVFAIALVSTLLCKAVLRTDSTSLPLHWSALCDSKMSCGQMARLCHCLLDPSKTA
ncbi:MAG: hypothetical protein AB7E42_01860 [Anaerotignaceae bacterium]